MLTIEKMKFYNVLRHFDKHLQNAAHLDAINIRKYAIEKSLLNDKEKNKFYLEFGVWKGTSINFEICDLCFLNLFL